MSTVKQYALKRKAYVAIKDGSRNSYGGNQGWFPEEGGLLKDKIINQHGCGVIAIADLFLYWAMTTPKGRDTFAAKYIGKFNEMTKEDYMEFIEEVRRHYAFIFGSLGTFGFELALGINRYIKENNLPYVARLDMSLNDITMLKRIKKSLEANQPIILMIGYTSPVIFSRWQKVGIPFYKQVRNIGSIRQKKDEPYAHYEMIKTGVFGHFVTITGIVIDEKAEIASQHIMLRIASWGEEFYISYHHLRTFIDTMSSPYSSALITISS